MTSTALDRITAALESAGRRMTRQGDSKALATCPAHDDGRPSLSLTQIHGQALVHCFAGCQADDIMAALNMTTRDLYDEPRGVRYDYTDAAGIVLRTVTRSPEKRFRQSGQTKGPSTLYRLPELLDAVAAGRVVYLVEGEKDADALVSVGAVATTAPMGASNWHLVDPTPLTGADVVVIADRDDAGRKWAHSVRSSLAGITRSLTFREAAEGKDAADHIAAGYGPGDLLPVQLDHEPGEAPRDAPEAQERREVGLLEFHTVAELRARVRARGPRQWLVRGVIVAGDYGVHGAEPKAGKSWNTTDLAVAVASGTPWLGLLPVDQPGPVLMFVGEGGEGNTLRRIDAAAAERGLNADDLPIEICARAPHLTDAGHLHQLGERIAATRPVLVTIDPLYLSARGAKMADLYAMGAVLEAPQRICQGMGAALFVVTHFNRKEGTGARRLSGAGPAEWGRFLISATVRSKRHGEHPGSSSVITELDIEGGEIPDHTIRVHRQVWADDPDDLDSPLHTSTSATRAEDDVTPEGDPLADLTPAARKVVAALAQIGGSGTTRAIGDAIAAEHGTGLKRETMSRSLSQLKAGGLVIDAEADDEFRGRFATKVWTLTTPPPPCDVTSDGHRASDRVIPCDPPYKGHAITSHTHGHTDTPEAEDHTVTRPTCTRCGDPLGDNGVCRVACEATAEEAS